jgi:hypothetical protein
MSRQVWHECFLLWEAPLTEALRAGRVSEVVNKYFPRATAPAGAAALPPVCLRWSSDPFLGFPRMPFQVWRRFRAIAEPSFTLAGPFHSQTTTTIGWGFEPAYDLVLDAAPAVGSSLTFQALGQDGRPIPGQQVMMNAAGKVGFRGPGIQSLLMTGKGTASRVRLTTQDHFANLPDWQRIETVGFPFRGEITTPAYHNPPQGFEPASLSGVAAASIRLDVARALQMPLPATGIPTIPTLPWPTPDPDKYLAMIRSGPVNSLALVRDCLVNTDDTDLSRQQVSYLAPNPQFQNLPGLRQANAPAGNPRAARASVPVVGVTLLGVSSDYYAATALGYGTIDVPPARTRDPEAVSYSPASPLLMYDYMVTARYTFAFGLTVELAALAQLRPEPTPANGLSATIRHPNRPPAMDGGYTAAVRLAWTAPPWPQSAGILVSHAPGSSRLLNHRQPAGVGGFDPYFAPGIPPDSQLTPEDLWPSFTDSAGPVPDDGTHTSTYLVVGVDVCGRWTDWRQTPVQFNAPDVLRPGLHSARLLPDPATAVGHVVKGHIEIEFSWDWADRSPDRVEFYSRYHPPDVAPGPVLPGTFQLASNAAGGDPVVVKFGAGQVPKIASAGHQGKVDLVNASLDPQPNSDLRKYRLTLCNATFDFTNQKELACAIYAAGAEHLRPGHLGGTTGPLRAHEFDPVPPTVRFTPPPINWTALPDATGRARGVLSWPAGDNATGYFLWESTETALRHIIKPDKPDPPPGTKLVDRAQDLATLVDNNQDKSLGAFARLNRDPITALQTEVELPGSANTLYAFRISAIGANQEESPRSASVAFFAVPRLMEPGQPTLLLRPDPQGIKVVGVAKPGFVAPAGFRVFRVRREGLAGDVGTMGPPRILENAAWTPYRETPPRGGTPTAGLAVVDTEPGFSWQPYYYRIVAIGPEDRPNGEWRGESLPSAVQSAFRPPPGLPMLAVGQVFVPANSTNQVIIFQSDLPIKPTPLGIARIELSRVTLDAATQRMVRTIVKTWEPQDIPVGMNISAVLPDPTPQQLKAMPEITRSQPPPDSSAATYTIRAARNLPAEANVSFTLTLRDPLGRVVQTTF